MATEYQTYRAGERNAPAPKPAKKKTLAESVASLNDMAGALAESVKVGSQMAKEDTAVQRQLGSVPPPEVTPVVPETSVKTSATTATGATGPATYQLPSTSTGATSAFETFLSQFRAMGLGDLANTLLELSKSPNAPQTGAGYYQALLGTPEYKARFGNTNAARAAAGLPMLTESAIMTAENNLRDTMRAYNMPAGFYDQPSDFADFISRGFSANEVGDAVRAWQDVAKQQDPAILAQLAQNYGIGIGDITAHLMDPVKAEPIISAIAQKGTTAAAAAAAGYKDIIGAAQLANAIAPANMSYTDKANALAKANLLGQQTQGLNQRFAPYAYSGEQAMQTAFGGPQSAQAANALSRLVGQEENLFQGGAGTQAGSLGTTAAEKAGGLQ